MNLDKYVKVEPYEQEGVAGPLWRITLDYQGLKLCGIGGNRSSLLTSMDRKIEEMADDLKIIANLLGQEAVK